MPSAVANILIRQREIINRADREGHRWVALLEDGTEVVGKPSWMGNSGNVALPNDEAAPMSDWRRLMARCLETRVRVKKLSLFVCGRWWHSPEGKGAYGYFESVEISGLCKQNNKQHRSLSGVKAVTICWDDTVNGVACTKGIRVEAAMVKGQVWPKRLPCMIAID